MKDDKNTKELTTKMVRKAKSLILKHYHREGFMRCLVDEIGEDIMKQAMDIAEINIKKYIDEEFTREEYWSNVFNE